MKLYSQMPVRNIRTSQGQPLTKEIAFNSILQGLSNRNQKIDPRRWVAICAAAARQESDTPPEFSSESFFLLKELAKNKTNIHCFARVYPAGFIKFLAIGFIGLHGKNAFNANQFAYKNFLAT